MRCSFILSAFFLLLPPFLSGQEPTHPTVEGPEAFEIQAEVDYRVFTGEGRPASLDDVLEALDGAEVLLVGEEHGNRVGHRLEEMTFSGALDRYAGTSRWVTLSLEMFERDVQYVLDEYLTGLITETHFLDSARPWEDYAVRYRPLVELARAHSVPVIAANAPRRYVNRVTREGPEALLAFGTLARYYLPPLPYPGPSAAYRAQWDEIMAQAMGGDQPAHGDSAARSYAGSENALQAQALWDASMGHAIAQSLDRAPERVVLHFAGSFHVERGTGIAERIEDYRPGTQVLSVVMTSLDEETGLVWDVDAHTGLADFVILTR